jgi:quercetin dioxygenase-like cupin family protein
MPAGDVKREYTDMKLNNDRSIAVTMKYDEQGWVPSPVEGVDRFMLERSGGEKATRATSIVTYSPESKFPEHVHTGGEEFLVLSGTFSDQAGNYSEGFYVRNPIGSSHAPWSKAGTKIFVKLGQFDPMDKAYVRLDTIGVDWQSYPECGLRILELHRFGEERIRLISIEPNQSFHESVLPNGAEIFVVSGRINISGQDLDTHDWWRSPTRPELSVSSETGSTFYLKTGHL